jgi:alkylation response protein AidB-like acyl-CoA dehydrogenase
MTGMTGVSGVSEMSEMSEMSGMGGLDAELLAASRRWFEQAGSRAELRAAIDAGFAVGTGTAPHAGAVADTAPARDGADPVAAFATIESLGLREMLGAGGDGPERAGQLAAVGLAAGQALYAGPVAEAAVPELAGLVGPEPSLRPADGGGWRRVVPALCGSFVTGVPSSGGVVRARGGRLTGRLAGVPYATHADAVVVAARTDDGVVLVRVDVPGAGITVEPVGRVDGSGAADVAFAEVAIAGDGVLASGEAAEAAVGALVEALLLANAARLIGAASQSLDETIDYLKTRRQFGQPLAAFQALQHRMAGLYVEVECGRALLEQVAACWHTERERRRSLLHALAAHASRSALAVTKAAVQMHGGNGFSHEGDAGLFLKHAMVLAARYGSAAGHVRAFGGRPGVF